MSAPALCRAQCFGFSPQVPGGLQFLDEDRIVFVCGVVAVVFNFETKEQSLLPSSARPIVALSLSANKKSLSIGELGLVNLFDAQTLKRRKVLNLDSEVVVATCYTPDSRFCLTQTSSPNYTLALWNIEKSPKLVCSTKVSTATGPEVYNADISPFDSSFVCLSGNALLRFYRVVESQFRPVNVNLKREPQRYTAHCWLADQKLVLGTDHGELLLLDTHSMEFRGVLPTSPFEGRTVTSLVMFNKGFLCGTEGGVLSIYESIEDAREPYRQTHTFSIANDESAIMRMALSPSEDLLCVGTRNQQIYSFGLSTSDLLAKEEEGVRFEYVLGPLHGPRAPGAENPSSAITGIDTCIWKPLVATCGVDRRVRVWNYQERSIEYCKTFEEEATALSLHPNGLYMLVAFLEKVRLMALLTDDVRVVKNFGIKNCRVVQFSNGGQFFAIATNATVLIYSTYTAEQLYTLRGHNAKVQGVEWKKGDKSLVTYGFDGVAFIWSIELDRVTREDMSVPRTAFEAGAVATDFSRCIMYGNDTKLRELDLQTRTVGNAFPVEESLGSLLLCRNHRLLIAGTAPSNGGPGLLKSALLPKVAVANTGATSTEKDGPGPTLSALEALEFATYICHGAPVRCMCLSHDENLLFSGAADGSFFVHDVSAIDSHDKIKVKEAAEVAGDFTEEILVTKTDINKQSLRIEELHKRVEELKLNNEYQLRVKEMTYKEKIQEVRDKFGAELESNRRRYNFLLTEKQNMERTYEDKIVEIGGQQAQECEDLEAQYQAKVEAEVVRYKQLAADREEENRLWDSENEQLVERHRAGSQKVAEEYNKKVQTEQETQQTLTEEKKEVVERFRKLQAAIETDAEGEIQTMKYRYEQRLRSEREANSKLKGENNIMRKKFLHLKKEVEDQKEEIRSLREKEKELLETIRGLEKDIHGHRKEIREREDTIQDKEKRIYDLKKKNQELEKFKFVLDYKIRELRRQIEPRENEITAMRTQIEEMDLELEQYYKSNAALDLMIGELRLKMDGMQREINSQRQRLQETKSYIQMFCTDLHVCRSSLEDHKRLKTAVTGLYHKYVLVERLPGSFGDTDAAINGTGDVQQAYNQQREFLERNVDALKRNIGKDVEVQGRDNSKLMREGAVLTKELNNLRRESNDMRIQHKKLLKEVLERGMDPRALGLEPSGVDDGEAAGPGAGVPQDDEESNSLEAQARHQESYIMNLEEKIDKLREELQSM